MPLERDEPGKGKASVFYPESEYTVVKYMDLAKYISLLMTRSLFFCRQDRFEDKFEGILPLSSKTYIVNWYKDLRERNFFDVSMPDELIEKNVMDHFVLQEELKKETFINCWNIYKNESIALWKIYSQAQNGIMIKSSVNRLYESLEKTPELIWPSEVRYINHLTDPIRTFGNTLSPVLYKHHAYGYEEEFRLIHRLGSSDTLPKDINEYGVLASVELDKLIAEVVVSPFSPKWFFDIIKDITNKYDLQAEVNQSVLTPYL